MYSTFIWPNFPLESYNACVFFFDFCNIFASRRVYIVISRMQYQLSILIYHHRFCFLISQLLAIFIIFINDRYILCDYYSYHCSNILQSLWDCINQKLFYPVFPFFKQLFISFWLDNLLDLTTSYQVTMFMSKKLGLY